MKFRFTPCVVWLALAATSFGQTFYGSIVGTVSDVSGGGVPQANVILTNLGTAERLSGNAERAADAYQQAVRGAGPNDAALVDEIGKAFTEMGKRDAAKQAFARAAALRR